MINGSDIMGVYTTISQLSEKYVKEDDPSLSVSKFLEKAGNSLSAIRSVYNKNGQDRQRTIEPIQKELDKLKQQIQILEDQFQKHRDGKTDPEDNNRAVG